MHAMDEHTSHHRPKTRAFQGWHRDNKAARIDAYFGRTPNLWAGKATVLA